MQSRVQTGTAIPTIAQNIGRLRLQPNWSPGNSPTANLGNRNLPLVQPGVGNGGSISQAIDSISRIKYGDQIIGPDGANSNTRYEQA